MRNILINMCPEIFPFRDTASNPRDRSLRERWNFFSKLKLKLCWRIWKSIYQLLSHTSFFHNRHSRACALKDVNRLTRKTYESLKLENRGKPKIKSACTNPGCSTLFSVCLFIFGMRRNTKLSKVSNGVHCKGCFNYSTG